MSDAEILGPGDPGPRNAKDANFSGDGSNPNQNGNGGAVRAFPWERLAFSVLYAFIAWFTFWLALVLAIIAGGLRLFGVQADANFGDYAGKATTYLGSVLAYVAGTREDKPFPFG